MVGKLKKLWILLACGYISLRHRTIFAVIRHVVAGKYIKGNGIEIGALHNPLLLPSDANVQYVDKWSTEFLVTNYPELRNRKLVKVNIVDDGENLYKFETNSLDFIIANHFLEHCSNPLRTIERLFSKLKTDGILYLTVPDKRYTFDASRKTTPLAHLLAEYAEGADDSEKEHVEEWVRHVLKIEDEAEAEKKIQELLNSQDGNDMHYHCWTQDELLDLILALKRDLGLNFETELFFRNGDFEVILILRKTGTNQVAQ